MEGTVKWFNPMKKFGFITPNGETKDVFVHENSIKAGPIKEGDKVSFEIKQDEKGRAQAVDVIKAGAVPEMKAAISDMKSAVSEVDKAMTQVKKEEAKEPKKRAPKKKE